MTQLPVQPYDPESGPPPEVVGIIESGLVQVIRRVEFYEADATTRWNPDGIGQEFARLIEGGVSLDMNSDERRKLDMSLENVDLRLRPNPNGGFWYDKVIKVFRGVEYNADDVTVPLAIIESEAGLSAANRVNQVLANMNFRDNRIMLDASVDDLRDIKFVVSVTDTKATQKAPILHTLWERGVNVVTVGVNNTMMELPHYSSMQAVATDVPWGIKPPPGDNPTVGTFAQEEHGTGIAGTRPTGLAQGAVALAVWPTAGYPDAITATVMRNGSGGFWFDFHLPNINGTEARKLLSAAMRYMRYIVKRPKWETQIGEFYIDGINGDHFPHILSITGRDATKKLMNDKLQRNSTFAAGSSLKSLVIGQLSLAGIPVSKMRLSIGDESLGSDMSYDKGTSRWEIIKSALDSFGYERYFDGFGNFVARKFMDPSTSPTKITFKTGPDGNLTSYSRGTSDSRIYNHVVVTSDPSDADANPIGYFGEARVEDESVPTHKNRIGNRTLPVEANWLSSDAECVALAQERLKVTALESYEMDFGSIFYPWMEVGEIVEILDPDAQDFEPTRYLLDTLNFPFALGPMDGTAKRVTFVGDAG